MWMTIPAFLLSVILTGAVLRYSPGSRLMDVPNHRSSHTTPTPRGGGLGLVLVFLGLVIYGLVGSNLSRTAGWALLGGAPVALVGFWDDYRTTKVRTRLLVHFLCAIWLAVMVHGIPVLDLGRETFYLGPLGYLIAVPATVWSINLYNFMDGIDGLAAGEAVSISGVAAMFFVRQGQPDLVWLSLALAACSLGFLVWNWSPAKIFMGDIGSGFLGYLFAALLLISGMQDPKTVWFWIILLAVFVVDATLTLLRRMVRGEGWYQAHRSHAYQWMSRKWGHANVTKAVILINITWLGPWAVISQLKPALIPVALILAYAPLVGLTWHLGAGRSEDTSGARGR